MKHLFKLMAIIVAVTCAVSCKPDPTTDPNQNWDEGGQTIAYTVDCNISSMTLYSDAEWDDFMGKLLDLAQEGRAVSFYNTDRASLSKSASGSSKAEKTFTTTDRQQMKDWCRKMEAEGKTVTIVYNKNTGVWSGTAYARLSREEAPALDEDYYYYGPGGDKKQCEIDTSSVYVAMSELADSVLLKQLMAMGDALRIYGNVIIVENLSVSYSTLQTMLENSGQLELLSPAIQHQSYPDPTIHAYSYPDSTVFALVEYSNIGRFHQMVREKRLAIVDSASTGIYYLSASSRYGLNTVRMAAELYETGLFIDVEPTLIESVDVVE